MPAGKRGGGDLMRRRKIQSSLPYQGLIAGIIFLDLWAYGGILQSGWVILCLLCVFGLIRLLKSDETADPLRQSRPESGNPDLAFVWYRIVPGHLSGRRQILAASVPVLWHSSVLSDSFPAGRKEYAAEEKTEIPVLAGTGRAGGITAVFVWRRGFPPGSRRKQFWRKTASLA